LEAISPKLEELTAVEAMLADTEQEAVEIGQAMKRASGLVARTLEQNMNEVFFARENEPTLKTKMNPLG
jgi:hypothetical protein